MFHQIHHSASRIETITSFYKHPLEIATNAILISLICVGIFGMDPAAIAVLNLLTCVAEFFHVLDGIETGHFVGNKWIKIMLFARFID